MSEYNTLDKAALDRWITREPDWLDDEEEMSDDDDENTDCLGCDRTGPRSEMVFFGVVDGPYCQDCCGSESHRDEEERIANRECGRSR
jgi:hypothetical protein